MRRVVIGLLGVSLFATIVLTAGVEHLFGVRAAALLAARGRGRRWIAALAVDAARERRAPSRGAELFVTAVLAALGGYSIGVVLAGFFALSSRESGGWA